MNAVQNIPTWDQLMDLSLFSLMSMTPVLYPRPMAGQGRWFFHSFPDTKKNINPGFEIAKKGYREEYDVAIKAVLRIRDILVRIRIRGSVS